MNKSKLIGRAQVRGNKLYFDETGWAILKKVARKQKKSPTVLVARALRRMMRAQNGKT